MAVEFTCLYLDANSLIYALESEDEDLRLRFRRLFETLSFFKIETSEISLAELLVDPHRTDDQARIEGYKKLFVLEGSGFLRVRPVSTDILTAAASFRGRQMQVLSRKPSLVDCIHAATAHHWGCSHFMTWDKRLKLFDQIIMVDATVDGIDRFLDSVR